MSTEELRERLLINENLLSFDDTVHIFSGDKAVNQNNTVETSYERLRTNKTIKELYNDSESHESENQAKHDAVINQESKEESEQNEGELSP